MTKPTRRQFLRRTAALAAAPLLPTLPIATVAEPALASIVPEPAPIAGSWADAGSATPLEDLRAALAMVRRNSIGPEPVPPGPETFLPHSMVAKMHELGMIDEPPA